MIQEARAHARDPGDEPDMDLAILADAAYLVSRDRDLLDLQDPASAGGQGCVSRGEFALVLSY